MTRILVIYYSQSGDVARVTDAFVRPLAEAAGIELTEQQIRPTVKYPYPWKSLARLLDVFPECIARSPPPIEPFAFSSEDHFDLVILSYQVWHLCPSLPTQAFLQSPCARVLRGAKVITLLTSRNMWQSASESMKQMLAELGAIHLDNVVVTHAGPPWTTFVSVPRALLFGRKDPLWGIFPSAEIGQAETARLERLGAVVRDKLELLGDAECASLLSGLDAVEVRRRYVIPERVAWYTYQVWCRIILAAERLGRLARKAAIYCLLLNLLLMIVIGLPLGIILTLLFYPFIYRGINRYATQLTLPSGGRITS